MCAYTRMQIFFKNTGFETRHFGITFILSASTLLLYMFHMTVPMLKDVSAGNTLAIRNN